MQERARAPRGSITRDRIVDAALVVIERDGADALSMRSVAAELGVRPMSLYNHVGSRDDLVDAMFELVLADVEFPDIDHGRWQDHIRQGATAFHNALRRRPALVPLVFARGGTGRAYFRATEHSLAIFRRGGFDPEEALNANRVVVGTIFGTLMNETFSGTAGPVASVPEGYPMLRQSAPHLARPDFDRAWEFALSTLIDGLTAQLRRSKERPSP